MSQQKHTTLHSTRDLSKIYQFNEDITEFRARILCMTYNGQKRGATINKIRNIHIENMRVRIDRLTLMRHDEIMRIYSHAKVRRDIPPLPRPRLPVSLSKPKSKLTSTSSTSEQIRRNTPISRPPSISMEIKEIDIKDNSTTVYMAPVSAKANEPDTDDDIIYPEGVTDFRPYKIVARYRKANGKSINFRLEPLLVDDNSTETLVLGLENFAQQHGCILSFTDEDQQFDQSVYHASCGLVDLGSIHLLATDSILTANFQFEVDLDYDTEFAQSEDNIKKFVHDFCAAISHVLSCENNNVRVFSIIKLADKPGQSQMNFGLTTPEPRRTEQLAHALQDTARSCFPTDTILRYVKPREYGCTWKPALPHLQIRLNDLDPRYNFDYRKSWVSEKERRGNHPYYLPRGWYRHALNVEKKYKDGEIWLGSINAEGEWPVAFHGTCAIAVNNIVQEGLLTSAVQTDLMRSEAVKLKGKEVDRPGLYVATHCSGGADMYAQLFTVTTFSDKTEQFRIVFQCRVEPDKFTIHKGPVKVGEVWRIVDPKAVRPYGILLKEEDSTKSKEET